MSKIVENYQEIKDLLLASFDQVVRDGFVDSEGGGYNAGMIETYKEDLAEQKFVVSVCGQIKAGKSTFLNYLLFDGRDILPVDATPWTAKLTHISYGEKECALVYFYNEAEWSSLKAARAGEGYQDVERSAAAGVYDREFIRSERKVVELGKLDALSSYVSREGVYTAFVSHVEIRLNDPAVRDVIIVDTPGINDPNELRSAVTTGFINQSSAVIYLFYSFAPLGDADMEFIDRHLSSVPSSKIVFGMGKCDLVKDIPAIRQYIEDHLRNDVQLKERRLLQDGRVYPFSTLAAIIKKKQEGGQPLTEDEAFFAGKMPSELVDRKGMIGDFVLAIERNVMKDKAAGVLDAAYGRITDICLGRINGLSARIGVEERRIGDLMLSHDELQQKIARVKKVREKISDAIDVFSREKDAILNRIGEAIREKKSQFIDTARSRYHAWVEGINVEQAIAHSGYEINAILSQEVVGKIDGTFVDVFFKDLKEFQVNLITELKNETKEVLPLNRWGYIFTPIIPIRKIMDEALAGLKNMAPDLEALRVKIAYYFTKKTATLINIEAEVYRAMDKAIEGFCDQLSGSVNKELKDFFDKLQGGVTGYLNKYNDELDGLTADSAGNTGEREKALASIATLQEKLDRFKSAFASIDAGVGARWRVYKSKI